MKASEIRKLLDELSDITHKRLDNIERHEDLMNKILTTEQKKKLARLDAKLFEENGKLDEEEKELRKEISEAVGAYGSTVENDLFTAVYVKPKETWDHKKLDGYAAAHPEVLKLKTVAESGSAQIRRKKE